MVRMTRKEVLNAITHGGWRIRRNPGFDVRGEVTLVKPEGDFGGMVMMEVRYAD